MKVFKLSELAAMPPAVLYLHIMKTFLKMIFLLLILAVLALVITHLVYKDRFSEKARVYLASKLSASLQRPVNIGSVGYVPFQSISMDRVSVLDADPPHAAIADINNITFTVDLLSLIKHKQLRATVAIDGLHAGDILCNVTIRTISRKADIYMKVLDPSLVDSVFVIEGLAAKGDLKLRDIFGTLKLDNMSVSEGKIHFTYNDMECLADLAVLPGAGRGYGLSVRSDNLGFRSTLLKSDGGFIIDELTGMFYTLHLDLKGEVRDLLQKTALSLSGTVETDLGTFAALPGEIGNFARRHPMSGPLKASLHFATEEPKLDRCELASTISGSNLSIDNFRIREIMMKLSLENGRLSAPLINGSLYDGTLTCDFKMDLAEKDRPYLLSVIINSADYGNLMRDIAKEETDVYGTLDADLRLQGYAASSGTAEGGGSIIISDADLGPMPLLTPLLGDLFTTLQNIMTSINKITIYEAKADFKVKDRKISTDNLVFMGNEVYITSEGYVDFDGNLDFSFQNQFRDQPPGQDEEWQIALRNAIVRFGKLISRAKLKGTVKDPKWEFEYVDPVKNLISSNIKRFLGTFE